MAPVMSTRGRTLLAGQAPAMKDEPWRDRSLTR